MSIFNILIISLILCSLFNFSILSFPENYKSSSSKHKINNLLFISLIAYIVLVFFLLIINEKINNPYTISFKASLLLIPSVSILVFTLNIYYPALRIALRENEKHVKFIDKLCDYIFKYKYSNTEERCNTIIKIKTFIETDSVEFKLFGITQYIEELVNRSQTINYKAPEALINWLENYCLKLKIETNSETISPFSSISIIASFCCSSLLTVLLAYVSII